MDNQGSTLDQAVGGNNMEVIESRGISRKIDQAGKGWNEGGMKAQ